MLMVFIYNSKEDAGLTGTGVETASSVAKLDGLSVDGLPDANGATMLGAVGASSVATGANGGLPGANGATMLGASAASSVATGANGGLPGASAAAMLGASAASSVATGVNGGLPGAGD